MAYKTIVVHLNDERRTERLLRPALDLARRYNSHLIGVHVYPAVPMTPPVAIPYGAEVLGVALAAERKEAEQIKAVFERMTANQAFVAEWRSVKAPHSDLAAVVMKHGRSADLMVASQADLDWDLAPVLDFPERLAMESGRPVLVVPNAGTFDRVGSAAVVAWNGSRESARAAFDALPLLKDAGSVQILSVAEEASAANVADTTLAAGLGRHGIKGTAAELPPVGSIGEAILSHVAANKADLLVMGAYGHSRFREFVFGGTTRHIARNMSVPTLFSH